MVGRTAVIGSGSWCKVKPKAINLAESSMWGWFRQSIKKVIFGEDWGYRINYFHFLLTQEMKLSKCS
jgi:hypothetical protein